MALPPRDPLSALAPQGPLSPGAQASLGLAAAQRMLDQGGLHLLQGGVQHSPQMLPGAGEGEKGLLGLQMSPSCTDGQNPGPGSD